jgi:hypothetical protein
MESFIKGLGRKYPAISFKDTIITIGYGGSVCFDFSDPRFFDQLDAVMTHLLIHDDLSAFLV